MNNSQYSAGRVVATVTWAAAVGLLGAVMVTGSIRLLAAGFLVMGVAATATVRSYFVAFSAMVSKAFEMDG